ncbi:O-antigen ligase [Deinococcus sp. QL22]|uniref:O-antigen ligase family protein n=1 Tax=Deinococcus sp. QL22 TaxID=2939437 RepID=UPI002017ACD4|nr:O-antigen ligase family protein [Deinococcus sp. QL22]UQN09566.1 O-antigen ligase family protein [Deinococcus sp. QL22]
MKYFLRLPKNKSSHSNAVVFLCIFLFFQADLKVTVWPYIHWVIAFVGLLLLICIRNTAFKIDRRDLFVLMLIPLAMAINFLIVPSIENVIQTYKVAIIFISIYIISNFLSIVNFKSILTASLVLNSLFLLFGILGLSWAARILTGDGRWGTLFNYPGSLYKVGLFMIVFGIYGMIKSKNKIGYSLTTVLCLFVMYMDGSRTAFILLGVALVYIIFIMIIEYLSKGGTFATLRLLVVFMTISISSIFAVNYKPIQESRIYKTILEVLSGEGGLAKADNIRYDMLTRVQEEITQHPIVGIGMGNTSTIVNGESITIHNAYLQIWSDAGILAVLALLLLMTYGVFQSRLYIRAAMQTKSVFHGAQAYNLSFLLIIMPITNLFHPFSTEWSDWSAYLLAIACTRVLGGSEDAHEDV